MNKFKVHQIRDWYPVHPQAVGRMVPDIFIEGHHFIVVVNFAPSVLSRIVCGKFLAL